MQAEGLQSLFPMEELSVMGIAEVLPKYLHLKRRIREAAAAALAANPAALIHIDSPDFCLRVAALVKAANPAPVSYTHLDLAALGQLTFRAPDLHRYPALRIAREVMACLLYTSRCV